MPVKTIEELTPEIARELLYYNPLTGSLSWRARGPDWFSSFRSMKSWNGKYALKNAGTVAVDTFGYSQLIIKVLSKPFSGSRAAWMIMTGEIPPGKVWHINRNALDLRWINLTCLEQKLISRNRPMLKSNSSGFCGVTWNKQREKWRSQIKINGQCMHLGYFSDIESAAEARRRANMLYGFGETHGVRLIDLQEGHQ